MRNLTKELVLVSLFAALISVFAQIVIPIPNVPFTGQTLAVGLTATILGTKRAVQAVLIYLLLGAIGVPVYAEMHAGIGILFGPTGGYLISFLVMAFLIGILSGPKQPSLLRSILANNIGMLVQLVLGAIWLKYANSMSWSVALKFGFYIFIPIGIVKAVLASWIGLIIRKRLIDARMLVD